MEWIVIALVCLALVVAVVAVLLGRSARAPRRRSGLRPMEREQSIGYFRDLGGRAAAPGVQEEDRSGRWGSTVDDQRQEDR